MKIDTSGKTAYWFESEQDAKEFLQKCDALGIRWSTGEVASSHLTWCHENTAIFIDRNILIFGLKQDMIGRFKLKKFEVSKSKMETVAFEKFLFVEEGSVDTKKLQRELKQSNPEIKVIEYKKNCRRPCLVVIPHQKNSEKPLDNA